MKLSGGGCLFRVAFLRKIGYNIATVIFYSSFCADRSARRSALFLLVFPGIE